MRKISTFTRDTAAQTELDERTKENDPYAEQSKKTKKKETSYFATFLLIISNNRRESPFIY